MENWVVVALILGSNAIIFLGNLLLMKNRVKAERETDKSKWWREVRSEPLAMLRNELARMAAKGESCIPRKINYVPCLHGFEISSLATEGKDAQ
jgi:hypothetical protein